MCCVVWWLCGLVWLIDWEGWIVLCWIFLSNGWGRCVGNVY